MEKDMCKPWLTATTTTTNSSKSSAWRARWTVTWSIINLWAIDTVSHWRQFKAIYSRCIYCSHLKCRMCHKQEIADITKWKFVHVSLEEQNNEWQKNWKYPLHWPAVNRIWFHHKMKLPPPPPPPPPPPILDGLNKLIILTYAWVVKRRWIIDNWIKTVTKKKQNKRHTEINERKKNITAWNHSKESSEIHATNLEGCWNL